MQTLQCLLIQDSDSCICAATEAHQGEGLPTHQTSSTYCTHLQEALIAHCTLSLAGSAKKTLKLLHSYRYWLNEDWELTISEVTACPSLKWPCHLNFISKREKPSKHRGTNSNIDTLQKASEYRAAAQSFLLVVFCLLFKSLTRKTITWNTQINGCREINVRNMLKEKSDFRSKASKKFHSLASYH